MLALLVVLVYDQYKPTTGAVADKVAIGPVTDPYATVAGTKVVKDFVTVAEVVDGDTIKISTGETVRYIGMDTPETKHPTKGVECFGKEASEYNKKLVFGKEVTLVKDVSDKDRYGRLLRYVYLSDGTFINKKLVDDGYAKAATFPPDVLFSKDFVKAEQTARTGQLGLWKACTTKVTTAMFDAAKQYTAVLHTTAGDITIQFNKGATPKTIENFVTLAEKGFYNGTIFHRTIQQFMIQGGDPTGTGSGGPGYRFDDEQFSGEYTRGTVAMANAGPNTNGSQFFIMHADVPLEKNYVIFGKVTNGLDVVDRIATAPVKAGGFGEASSPVSPVVIETVEITVK